MRIGSCAIAVISFLIATIAGSISTVRAQSGSESPTVLITGSNRGLGFQFASQYAAAGWHVIATARKPAEAEDLIALASEHSNVTIEQLDLTDHQGIDALAEKYADTEIDLLLNNAAQLGQMSRQQFGSVDYDLFRSIIDVNVIGTLKVTEAFAPHVEQSSQKKIAILGSIVGTEKFAGTSGNFYAYGASKAALHYVTRHIAFDLKDDGITVFALEPGFADSRGIMSMKVDEAPDEETRELVRMVQASGAKMQPPEQSVAGMIAAIESVTPEQSGTFISDDGDVIPW